MTNTGMRFEEFIISKTTHELYNGQARLLASENDLGITFDDKKELDNNDLELAKLHLKEHFIAVGVLERFDEFVGLLKHLLGWRDSSYEKKSVSGWRIHPVTVSNKTPEIIRNNN
jgi:hypothetical protein